MKKWYSIIFLAFLVITTIFVGCGGSTPGTSSVNSTTAKTTTSTTFKVGTLTPTTTTATQKVVTGGVMRRIINTSPTNLGYPPGGSVDVITLERLGVTDVKAEQQPNLFESYDFDPVGKTLVWHIRKGITFTDGTDFDAEALKWNYLAYTEGGRMNYPTYIKSYEVLDKYTLKMNLSEVNNQLIFNWAFVAMMSPTAFNTHGADWCRQNAVTTGSFIVKEYVRDSRLVFTKNPNYWMKGFPYLDGLESIVVPDYMVSSGMMEAKQADIWATSAQYAVELEKKGLKVRWQTAGNLAVILFDSADPTSPFSNLKVREAVEYAINRPAMAKMIGYGVYEPATQMEMAGLQGYNEGFDPRPYNVEKAKALLKEAGFPSIKTTLMASSTSTDSSVAIKAYLAAVGIDVDIDMADNARYRDAWVNGFKGMLLTGSGVAPNGASILTHYGPTPQTFRTKIIYKSPAYLDLCDKMLHVYTSDGYIAAAKATIKQASDDVLAVPLYFQKTAIVYQPWVHSTMGLTSSSDYIARADWMDAH
jgi:peptide/nickel transport system substrate-binding protein